MTLELLKTASTPAADRDVCLVTPLRNEIALIGDFLAHYHSIGVAEFIFVDNGSTDGTLELILADDRCTVYRTEEDFGSARYGMNWIETLLIKHAIRRWGLFVDCDEHLIFPEMDRMDVNEFAWRQHERGHNSMRALMLDMYHDGNVRELPERQAGESIYNILNLFDSDYRFRRTPQKPWRKKRGGFQAFGGPRHRLLSNIETEYSRDWIDATLYSQIDRFIDIVPSAALRELFRKWPVCVPALHKRPLNFVHEDFRYSNNHETNNKEVSSVMTGLIHLKFCNELCRCFTTDTIEEHHYRRGLEREQLRLALLSYPHETLVYDGTRKYRNFRDVEAAGLIGDFGDIAT